MTQRIERAEVLVPATDPSATADFLVAHLGFVVESVVPADDPRVIVVHGHGVRLRIDREALGDPPTLVLRVADGGRSLTAPNGMRIVVQETQPVLDVPRCVGDFAIARAGASPWVGGRAGMQYRDLVHDRLGGHAIASHIRIVDGGPVADYVHFHRVRFQMIYCRRGWVRLVYEDQGPPFVMREGDCVLQPPQIRHRVLECSPGLEVIEVGVPAEHETHADLERELPTPEHLPHREFDGQRFVHHVGQGAPWQAWRAEGFVARDTAIATATGGLADVRIARPGGNEAATAGPNGFRVVVVCGGTVTLNRAGERDHLADGDACVIPPGLAHTWQEPSDDLLLLEVTLRT